MRDVLIEQGQTLFSGRIDVDASGLAGVVHMGDGIILEARLGTTSGEPALWRMLLPERASITVEPGKPRATAGAVLGKPDALLARYDERVAVLHVYAEKVGGFDRVWALRFDALAALLEELPDAINPILRLLDGKRSVRQVVAESPLDDMLALRILGRLLALGVLVLPDDVVQRSTEAAVVDVDEGLEAALAASLAEIEAEEAANPPSEPILLTTRTTPPATTPPATTPPATTPPATDPPAPAAPGTTPPKPAPRAVTMMPREASDTTLPVVIGLPSAPPLEKQDELRSWLGSEEEFFNREHRRDVVRPRSRGLSPLWMVAILVVGAALGALLTTKGC